MASQRGALDPSNNDYDQQEATHLGSKRDTVGLSHISRSTYTSINPNRSLSLLSSTSSRGHQDTIRKRKRQHPEENNTVRRKLQLELRPTPSSTPFQTLKVIKPHLVDDRSHFLRVVSNPQCPPASYGQSWPEYPHSSLPLTTIERLRTSSNHPLTSQDSRQTTNGKFGGATKDAAIADDLNFPNIAESMDEQILESLPNHSGTMKTNDVPQSHLVEDLLDADNEYSFDGLDERDMAFLLNITSNIIHEEHIPPSSVTKAWDHDSQTAAEYDSTLQYSSPQSLMTHQPGPKATTSSLKLDQKVHHEEHLLDEDVDWDIVLTVTNSLPKNLPIAGSSHILGRETQIGRTEHCTDQSNISMNDDPIPPSPFSRPPFPEKVRDRSCVPGVSSDSVLRTCFRMSLLISQTHYCYHHRQNVVFEMYARVTYSNRESLSRKQHFQFMDLWKDQHPYPSGILLDWKVGSRLDRQSSGFLDARAEPKLCHCICEPVRDTKMALGWIFKILDIKETNWEHIQCSRRVLCGDDGVEDEEGSNNPAVTSEL
ncbi:hypothetical protein F5Y15DRAFT_392270 [Xylariaceae sp. FL0016]|nr:hypothetical protein F5Y15DRAFT_392270 [Xylariaceae sp. FL0016]